MSELKIRTAPVISPSAILVSIHFFNFRLSLITGALPVTACMFSIMIGCTTKDCNWFFTEVVKETFF